MTTWDYVICDVFTDRPLAGNQLAVFPDARPIPDRLLQPLAREINFSETVFVYPASGEGVTRLRIFTPAAELRFAGHPVLGTAVVLGTERGIDEIALETGAGPVPVRLQRDGDRAVFGRMSQPIPTVAPFAGRDRLLAALGLDRSLLPIELYDNGVRHVYVALADEDALARLTPDFAALAPLAADPTARVVGVNCFAGAGHRWTTRMFAAREKFEDPATGSAAGPLACHLARHGWIGWGDEMEIAQGAAVGRPSTLFARAGGTAERIDIVEVGGAAVVVGRGAFDPAVVGSA